ncbi:helix-turn-helix domain-containing protein [Cohnella panacarvi]|uniref:helix-turn-helix domain-containing protein n=1 Tax=Cohnella panacarvi TaxID=400776 RepID=UPI00047E506D|nr:AraC family transcriptional regulator [Cohnella panacarvi]
MNNLAIQRITPHPVLSECIRDLWVFESDGRLSQEEIQIIAPNGSVKLTLHYRGKLVGRIGDHAFVIPEHRLSIVGISDRPLIAAFDRSKPFGCISIELHPASAYRLFAYPQYELRNAIVPFGEIFGTAATRSLEERIYSATNPTHKAALLQEFLIRRLALTEIDYSFERSADAILKAQGLLSVKKLSQVTGLSDRWQRNKFADRLGVSPKTFASLVRFQASYQALLRNKRDFLQAKPFNDSYYDQAHFIKEFKRFIGYSPAKYSKLQNKVGETVYHVKDTESLSSSESL